MSRQIKIIALCDQVIRGAFCFLIFFLPVSSAMVEILSGVIIIAFFVRKFSLLRLPKRVGQAQQAGWREKHFGFPFFLPEGLPFYRAFSAVIFTTILASVFSQDAALSLKGFYFKFMQGVILFTAMVETFNGDRQGRRFFAALLLGGLLAGCKGIIQFGSGEFIEINGLIEKRITSFFNHPNDFAAYLIAVMPISLGVWKDMKTGFVFWTQEGQGRNILVPKGKVVIVFGFLLSLLCLGLTYSRGAWLGFVLALALWGIRAKELRLYLFVIGMIFMIIFVPQLKSERNVGFFTDYISQGEPDPETSGLKTIQGPSTSVGEREQKRIKNVFNKLGGMGRKGYWQEALLIIRDHPLLGTGLNTYSRIAPRYSLGWGGYPHNCYLHMAAETGLLGLGSFLWLIAGLVRNSCQTAFSKGNNCWFRYLAQGLLAGLIAYFIHGFFDTNFYSVQLGCLLWVMMALNATCSRRATSG